MLLDVTDCQLVLVDYQERLLPKLADGEHALANGMRLARLARLFDVPTIRTEHCVEKLGPTPDALGALAPQVLHKTHFSAVADGLSSALRPPRREAGNARSLPKHLRQASPPPTRQSVVLAGAEAHVCVLQTALDLLDDEFEVWLVTDASAACRVSDRDAAFDRLAAAGAELVTTQMVAFEWLRDARDPRLSELLSILSA